LSAQIDSNAEEMIEACLLKYLIELHEDHARAVKVSSLATVLTQAAETSGLELYDKATNQSGSRTPGSEEV
jgi:hypothetical protein